MSTSHPLIRIPLTLAAALAFHLCMTPPGQPEPTNAHGEKISSSARVIVFMLTRGIYWATALSEVSTHFPLRNPPALFSALPSLALRSIHDHDHTPLIAGTALAITGALIRLSAQRTLGRFYAHPRPRPGHALMTDGPYNIIRHPGYAGLAMCTMGVIMIHLGAAVGAARWSWRLPVGDLAGAGVHATISPVWIALACAVVGTVGAVWRIETEEEVLKETFRKQWEEYAARVRYRLIPGMY